MGTVETATNKIMLKTLDFDASTQEFAQFSIAMPKSWNEGTISSTFWWSHPTAVTNFGVVWEIQGVAISNDDPLDVAFGTEIGVSDTGGTANDLYQTTESAAVTIGGSPAALDTIMFQVRRAPANTSDTLAVDARLHGVLLNYTIDTSTDA
jgi:hypothetical protein